MAANPSPHRFFTSLCALGVAFVFAGLTARAHAITPGSGASATEMTQLIDAIEREPGGMTRWRGVLEKLDSAQMAQVVAATGNTHHTWLYPMVLRARDYPALIGQSVAGMSLLAMHAGQLRPIPFQMDEFDSRGLIYVPGTTLSNPLLPEFAQRTRKTDGETGIYDRSDELVFMFRDAGLEQASAAALARLPGKIVGTLRLHRDGVAPRWVYVLQGTPLRSEADYVNVDLTAGTAQTTVADIGWDPASIGRLKLIAPRVGPSSGKNIIDGVYGEVSTGILQKNLRFSLNTSDNIRLQPIAVRDGPIRCVLLLKTRIIYAGLPIYHDFTNAAIYEQGASLMSRVQLDNLESSKYFVGLVKDPRFEVSVDFANLDDAEMRWQILHNQSGQAIIDGNMSATEQRMNSVEMPGDWIWLDSRRGWQFFMSNTASMEPDGLLHELLYGMNIRMVYEDGANFLRKGERIPGASPRFGVRVSGMPQAASAFLTTLADVDAGSLRNLDDLVDRLIQLDEQNKLTPLNQAIGNAVQRLVQRGQVHSVTDLADLLVRDVRRLGLRSADRERLAPLVRQAVMEAGSLQQPRLGRILRAFRDNARRAGLDIDGLQFAKLDNALWFPDSVGDGGPAAFDREARNPPVAELLPP